MCSYSHNDTPSREFWNADCPDSPKPTDAEAPESRTYLDITYARKSDHDPHHPETFELHRRKCRRRYCPVCCPYDPVQKDHIDPRGQQLLNGLTKAMSDSSPRQITLTIDPARFDSSEDYKSLLTAFSDLKKSLAKSGLLNSARHFAVIEWHRSGHPHVHAVLDSHDDPEFLRTIIAERWPYGEWQAIDVCEKPISEAASYVTKSLVKPRRFPLRNGF